MRLRICGNSQALRKADSALGFFEKPDAPEHNIAALHRTREYSWFRVRTPVVFGAGP